MEAITKTHLTLSLGGLFPFLPGSRTGKTFLQRVAGSAPTGPTRTAEYGDELGMGRWAPSRRCTTQTICVGELGAEWEGLSHGGWKCRLDGPSGGGERGDARVTRYVCK